VNENGDFHAEEVCGGRSECEQKGHFPAWISGYYFRKLYAVQVPLLFVFFSELTFVRSVLPWVRV